MGHVSCITGDDAHVLISLGHVSCITGDDAHVLISMGHFSCITGDDAHYDDRMFSSADLVGSRFINSC